MNIQQRIEARHDALAICYRMTGDYAKLDYRSAWGKIANYCEKRGLPTECADAEYINVYYDDPETTPAEQCSVDVCVAADVVKTLSPGDGIDIRTIEGGNFIVFLLKGPYEQLGEADGQIYSKLLPEAGVKPLQKPMFERYLNDPGNTNCENLLTEIWIPIEKPSKIDW